MKILITGNMGYIGTIVVQQLRSSYPRVELAGFDTGYFAHCLTTVKALPECLVDMQYFADIRRLPKDLFKEVDVVVHLAAISNDPIGNVNEEVTLDINYRASIELAKQAKLNGVRNFVFTSSCSIYGFAEEEARTEKSQVNPLTAYAKSKVFTERELEHLANKNFKVTCFRLATACGMSERLRLDLVLNDFVASAVASNKITIFSDGTPWRPLINVKDIARAVDWAISRDLNNGGEFVVVNVGSEEWNYRIKDLAEAVRKVIPSVEISINKDALPDKRSYKVNFDLFKKLAPSHQPIYDIATTITELKDGLNAIGFKEQNFRDSSLIRLNVLQDLKNKGLLSNSLNWIFPKKIEKIIL